MIYEFSGGTERYELGLTKGKIDKGETPVEAAGRGPECPHGDLR